MVMISKWRTLPRLLGQPIYGQTTTRLCSCVNQLNARGDSSAPHNLFVGAQHRHRAPPGP